MRSKNRTDHPDIYKAAIQPLGRAAGNDVDLGSALRYDGVIPIEPHEFIEALDLLVIKVIKLGWNLLPMLTLR